MKKSELTFSEGFLGSRSNNNPQKVFDWDKAAEIINDRLSKYNKLSAEAGLQGDWNQTGGLIFENGFPTNGHYTYLSSNWAIPTLLIFEDGVEIEEIECYTTESRFDESSKWDEKSLYILGIGLMIKNP
jgi:hypothetical protein